FSAEGNGKLTLTIADKPALEAAGDLSQAKGKPLMLRKGRNKLLARYESPATGDALLRLFWTSEEVQREPVPTEALSHDLGSVKASKLLRDGRELLASRRCLKCHVTDVKVAVPEASMDAPSLEAAGARLRPEWMARWIRDPRRLRPEATMPRGANMTDAEAADIAAWLATLGAPAAEAPKGDVALGGKLFAEMRCVGCHTLPGKAPAADRIPLQHVKGKWRPAALVAFLVKPDAHYAWIEMPVFGLKAEEAANLAAFLLERSSDVEPLPAGDAAKGLERAKARGCVKCHAMPAPTEKAFAALAAIPAEGWSRGCMSDAPTEKTPELGLSKDQKDALRAFVKTDLAGLTRDTAPEFAERQMRALRCAACHKRDDRQDLWGDLADETKDLLPKKKDDGEFAEFEVAVPVVPPLTWTGEKLKPEWMAAFLAGKIQDRPRPYLASLRMPAFPVRAEGLAAGLALEHGCPPTSPPAPAPKAELSEIGRGLSGPGGGLDCLACHAIAGKSATKVFEAPAPNFKYARDRLRPDYFVRWVREPLRVEPGTKMPQFFQGGRSQLTEVLGGDASKQIDALWNYLLEGPAIKAPGE
ncbi:MAG TPA: c-type cytochrome, partial [Planctomycetota bacterium]